MKQIIRATLAVGCVLVGTTAIAACDKSEAGPTNGAPEVALAERRNLEINAEAVGLIEPIRIVDVKSKASGEVLRLMVETGDNVERGALLAEIDPRDVRNGLAQAQADLDVAEARHRTSKAQRQRAVELRKANVITEQEYEAAELDEANANTQLVKARTNLELAQERMNDVRITSPISGTVISKTVEVGTIIASASQTVSGGTTLLQMADLSEMQVRTLVDETDMGKITAGMSARVTVSAYPNRNFMGTVLKIEPQAVVEQNVTMFPVLIQLDNRERLLRPGMNAEVAIEVARRDDVVTVPNAAVVGMRDAAAAGLVLGLSEETVRAALTAGMNGGRMGQNDAAAQKSQPDSAGGAAAGGAAGANAGDECAALLQKARTDRNSLTEAERNKLRECMPQGGMRRGGPGQGGAGQGGREGNGETRMGIIFVQTATGPAPRRVVLGVNDWDHTEVVQGLEPGEAVVLMSVARIQQQQQQMLDRMRQSQSGPFPAAGGRR
jgi:HlyD family secretion protein